MPAQDTASMSIAPSQPVALGAQWEKLSAPSVHPWIAAFVGLHAFAIVAGVAAAYYVKVRLDALSSTSSVISRQATELNSKVGDLAEQSVGIKAEGTELRQYIASGTAEQIIFLKILILKPDIDLVLARGIARHTHHYAALYKRDPDLVLAIIAEESRFNPNAVSPVGAIGLMQVMPQWEKVLGISGSLKDPEVAIKYGLEVLGFYMEMYKDIELALTAYNRGPGPVDVAMMRGKDPKNRYAPEVLKVYERLRKLSLPLNGA
jgi:transglycosylase-like protein with SLT domain